MRPISEIIAEIQAKHAALTARRAADREAQRRPGLEKMIARNKPDPMLGGMCGMLQTFNRHLDPRYHRASAASWLLYLRENRLALQALGRDPKSADANIIARIRHHRREAARLVKALAKVRGEE